MSPAAPRGAKGQRPQRNLNEQGQAVARYYTAATDQAFKRSAVARARDLHDVSMSQIGKCLRQSAFKLARTPPDPDWDERHGRASEMGTWLHEGFLPALAARQAPPAGAEGPTGAASATGTTEHRQVLRAAGIEIPGTHDRYEPDCPLGPAMVDLKTVGDYMWQHVLDPRRGVPDEYVWQLLAYALAAFQQGNPVEWLVWIFLHRETGEEWVVVQAFTPDDAAAVLRRVAAMVRASANPTDPELAPRGGPGPSAWLKTKWSPCDGCAWLAQCWGQPRPPVAPQAAVVREVPEGAARAVAAYAGHRQVRGSGEQGMQFARAALTGVPPGTYPDPDTPGAAWSYGHSSNGAVQVRPAKPATEEQA